MGSADREYMKDVAADYMPPAEAITVDDSEISSLRNKVNELAKKDKESVLSQKAAVDRISKLESQLKVAVSEANRLQAIIFSQPPIRNLAEAVHILAAAMRIIPFNPDENDLYRRIFVGAITFANNSLRESGSLCDIPSHQLAKQIMESYFAQCTERERRWHDSQGQISTPDAEEVMKLLQKTQ